MMLCGSRKAGGLLRPAVRRGARPHYALTTCGKAGNCDQFMQHGMTVIL